MSEATQKWGTKNRTEWALIEAAPFTASGLNEILATTVTRAAAFGYAGDIGFKVSREGRYQIVRLDDLRRKEAEVGDASLPAILTALADELESKTLRELEASQGVREWAVSYLRAKAKEAGS